MSRILHYGDTVSINIPSDTSGRAVTVDGGAPRVTIASQGQAGQKRWTIFKPGDQMNRDQVKFGDVIVLKSADGRGYLTCVSGNTSVSITNDLRGGAWLIFAPDGSDKRDVIKAGDTVFGLESMIGGNLSRQRVSDTSGVLTYDGRPEQETSRWVFGFQFNSSALGAPLRYGNVVSILGQFTGSAVAADTGSYIPGSDQYPIVSGADDKAQQWIVKNFNDRDSVSRIKFGDRLLFTLDAPTTGLRYLTCRRDLGAGPGYRAVHAGTYPGEWEGWHVFDPQDRSSRREIKVGDAVVLQNMEPPYYLSLAKAKDANSPITARMDSPAGVPETWVFSPVLPTDDDTSRVDLKALRDMPPSNSQMALLSLNTSLQRKAALGAAKGLDKVVPGASMIGEMTADLYFPQGDIDIWGLIKDKVAALIDDKIDENNLKDFQAKLATVMTDIDEYMQAENVAEKEDKMDNALQDLTAARNALAKLGKPQSSLPYLVTFATLHISMLYERLVSKVIFPQRTPNDVARYKRELKAAIAGDKSYTQEVEGAREQARLWRRSLIKRNHAVDDYYAERALFYVGDLSGEGIFRQENIDLYIKDTLSYYDQLLEIYRLPSYLWRYCDPDVSELPVKKTAVMTTEHGRYRFLEPLFDTPEINRPITSITVDHDGDRIQGMEITYSNRTTGWRGRTSERRVTHTFQPGERIVEVRGRHTDRSDLSSLSFVTNKGARIEAGGRDGDEWVSKPDSWMNAHLIGISIWDLHRNLGTINLHWQYDYWA